MITMLLGGLWHGASWRFVAWGGLHGAYLCLERFLRTRIGHVAWFRAAPVQPILALLTFICVCVGWVFFRARSFYEAFHLLGLMFGIGHYEPTSPGSARGVLTIGRADYAAMIVLAGILWTHWQLRDSHVEAFLDRLTVPVRVLMIAGMMIALLLVSGDERAFIY